MTERGQEPANNRAVDVAALLGSKVGNFRLVSTIGKGGMGVVYAAEHELMGKKAAVKVLLPELSTNKEIVGRFFNEARAATKINHPGIVDIYDFGYHQTGHAYIVMEFLAGESLAALLKKGLHFGRVIDIAWQLGSALGAAHRRGIVHRDVKPDNIFVIPDPATPTGDRVKVLDFGIAKLTGDDGVPSLHTRTGAVMGTPIYMSPEQCKGAGDVDQRSDIYGMGVIMYEMACGQPPFVRRGYGELISAHIVEAPPLLSSLNPSVPPAYEAIVMRMLEKDPASRFQSTDDIEAALAGINPEVLANVARIPSTAPGVDSGRSKLRRRRLSGLHPAALPEVDPNSDGGSDGDGHSVAPVVPSRTKWLVAAAGAAVVAAAIAALATSGRQPPGATSVPASGASSPPAVEEAPAAVRVTITSTPSGASVVRAEDGAFLGRTPYQALFPRAGGEMALIVRLEGFVDQRVAVPLLSDGRTDVTLKALAAAAGGEEKKSPPTRPKISGATKSKTTPPASPDGKAGKKKRNWGDLVDF